MVSKVGFTDFVHLIFLPALSPLNKKVLHLIPGWGRVFPSVLFMSVWVSHGCSGLFFLPQVKNKKSNQNN